MRNGSHMVCDQRGLIYRTLPRKPAPVGFGHARASSHRGWSASFPTLCLVYFEFPLYFLAQGRNWGRGAGRAIPKSVCVSHMRACMRACLPPSPPQHTSLRPVLPASSEQTSLLPLPTRWIWAVLGKHWALQPQKETK